MPPPEFAAALASLRAAAPRPELRVSEIAAPSSLAPWAVALSGDVGTGRHGDDSELGTGRFVLSANGSSFTGSYNFGGNPDVSEGSWNGTRVAQ